MFKLSPYRLNGNERIPLAKRIFCYLFRSDAHTPATLDLLFTDGNHGRVFNAHYGVAWINYNNYQMCRNYPLLFNIVIEHEKDEFTYIDGQTLTNYIIESLEKALTGPGLDETHINKFEVVKSTILRTTERSIDDHSKMTPVEPTTTA